MSQSQANEAYQRGDYATAISLLRPLAAAGSPSAQFTLGLLYDKGLGVPPDPVQAHFWYALAAANGDAEAVTSRDHCASMMTAAQLSAARDLAQQSTQVTANQLEWLTMTRDERMKRFRRMFPSNDALRDELLAAIKKNEEEGRRLGIPTKPYKNDEEADHLPDPPPDD